MLRAISTYIHLHERLHPGILDKLAAGGAQGIEVFAVRGHFDYEDRQQVREIASWFGSQSEVAFQSMHAPMFAGPVSERFDNPPLNIAARERKDRIAAMDEIKRAIAVAETIPFRYLIVHVGVLADTFDDHKFDGALSSIEHLRAFAKPLGVRLLLENIPNELTTPQKLVETIRTLHYDDLGVCLDLGHAHIGSGVESSAEVLLPHLRSVHVHDNKGEADEHLWPGEGTIDWKRTMELLRTAPQVPALVLEIKGSQDGNPSFGKTVPPKMLDTWKTLDA
jgi:xylose isomerase-like TIM barrel protein